MRWIMLVMFLLVSDVAWCAPGDITPATKMFKCYSAVGGKICPDGFNQTLKFTGATGNSVSKTIAIPSGVTAVTGVAPVVSSGGATPSISIGSIPFANNSSGMRTGSAAATTKVTPVTADTFNFWDSITGGLRKLTWGNIVSTLTIAFNSVYDAYGAAAAVTTTSIGAQPTLVSGTNIKTINSTSILGPGDISIPAYTLPTATISTLGGVSPDGATISITSGGVISVIGACSGATTDGGTATSSMVGSVDGGASGSSFTATLDGGGSTCYSIAMIDGGNASGI